ncbi:MAG: MBL fold metallo-hydrolase [Anaerolineae bacterium]|nr:MBL fold metallo-hydrolase [Anaerolineae bacterium]
MPRWKPWDWPFHPAPTGRVDERVYAVRNGDVNMYVYVADGALIAIDAGKSAAHVRKAWARLPLALEDVAAMLLTHGDYDHVGGLALFSQAALYLSAEEGPLVSRGQPRFLGRIYNPELEYPFTPLEDGQVVEVAGIRVQAIATPGHTIGSMSYLVDEQALFVGDTLSLRRGQVAPFLRFMNMDTPREEASIRKLASLEGVKLLCTGHSGCTRHWDEAIAPWRA